MKRGEEYYTQQECVAWFKQEHPDWILFSVPNEACYRNKPFFAATGLLDGVSDLIAVTNSNVIFIELKSSKGRQTPAQKAFQEKIESLGWQYYLVRDVESFCNIFS